MYQQLARRSVLVAEAKVTDRTPRLGRRLALLAEVQLLLRALGLHHTADGTTQQKRQASGAITMLDRKPTRVRGFGKAEREGDPA